MDNESDDDLEETPAFIKNASPIKSPISSRNVSPQKVFKFKPSNKLDLLLSEQKREHEEEERLKKAKEEIMRNINLGSQEDSQSNDNVTDSLAEEHACHLEQLELKTSEMLHVRPGIQMFNLDNFCCLFDLTLSPEDCDYVPSSKGIDKQLATVQKVPGRLQFLLQSKILTTGVIRESELDKIMLWLFFLMSVHPSALVSKLCYSNLMALLQDCESCAAWYPTALQLAKLFVNLGADENILIGDQEVFSAADVRLLSPNFKSSKERKTIGTKDTSNCTSNLSLVLKFFSVCLHARPKIFLFELNLMFIMICKLALDSSLHKFSVKDPEDPRMCLNSIIGCYDDNDWTLAVPDLCKQASALSSHHHDHAHLCESLTALGRRGEFLQLRLAYLCLRKQLGRGESITDEEIMNFELLDVAWLGQPHTLNKASTLTSAILELVDDDQLYKVSSILRLLDLAVGSDKNRSTQPKGQLEFLLSQVKLIIRGIRDNIFQQDQSKVKDFLSNMKIKWSMALHKENTSQRSIFAYATATHHQKVLEEQLRAHDSSQTDIDEDVS